MGPFVPGPRTTLGVLLGCTALFAPDEAGRPGEDGSGAMWIAPELVARKLPAEHCVRGGASSRRDLVFEIIQPEEEEPVVATFMGHAGRVVEFEWNAHSSELTIVGSLGAEVPQDQRAAVFPMAPLRARSCGSP